MEFNCMWHAKEWHFITQQGNIYSLVFMPAPCITASSHNDPTATSFLICLIFFPASLLTHPHSPWVFVLSLSTELNETNQIFTHSNDRTLSPPWGTTPIPVSSFIGLITHHMQLPIWWRTETGCIHIVFKLCILFAHITPVSAGT
jgi:hypothetical protein